MDKQKGVIIFEIVADNQFSKKSTLNEFVKKMTQEYIANYTLVFKVKVYGTKNY